MLYSTLLRQRFLRLLLPVVFAFSLLLLLATITSLAANTIVWKPALTGLPSSGVIRDVAFGDFNNDGQLDLISAGTNGIVVYKGDGAGNWNGVGLSAGLPTTGQYGHVIVGDFNNDGKLDIAATQNSTGPAGAWTGNGAGSWTAWSGLPTGTYEGLAFADVNHDGWPDLIIAGGAAAFPGILVFQNNSISFSQTTSITTTGSYFDLAVGYVDGDNWLDVAAAAQASTGGGVKFWRGNFGTWLAANNGLTTTNTFRGVTFGDVDLDGKPDLLTDRLGPPSAIGGGIFIYKYDTVANTWSLAPNQIPLTNSYYKLLLDDLNNDGWLDLTAGGSTASSLGLFTYLGSATGFISVTPPITTGSFDRPATGDFDHNGLIDIAAAGLGNSGVGAWSDQGVSDPIGAWTPLASPQITGVMNALGYGDFNRDGDLDVVMSRDVGAGLVAYAGDGGNSWTTCPITMAIGAQTGTWLDVAVGPWGNNGSIEPDVIAASGSGGGIRYFVNSRDCAIWDDFSLVPTGSYRGLSVADMDHDFAYDIVAASASSSGLQIWPGPNHTAYPPPTSVGTYYDTALGDFNHDGKLDIIAAGDTNGLQSFKQASLRSFQQITISLSSQYYAVAVGDMNNDGNLDVVAAKNGTSNGVEVWLGDGTMTTWTPWPSPDTTNQFLDVAVGDVNHDGWLDILAGGENVGPQVWLSDGAGGWKLSTNNLPADGTYFRSLFGHIDHDGNLDILTTIPGSGLQMWTAAEATPPTISNIRPSGWITTTQSPTILGDVIDTGLGISTTSGLYRYSTNGGSTWSGLFPAAISGSNGSTSTQSITASNVPFNQDSGTQNKIEFRASDVVGNLGTAQATIKIDITPPTTPTFVLSLDHTPNVWSNLNTISIEWGGATDATSGVYGYAVLFDQNPSTVPPPTTTLYFISLATSPALTDGNNWYAHVRTRDVAGNWSIDARHLGPFFIDTTPPNNPTSVSSSSHALGVWSSDPSITMNWSGASDPGGSGVSGYSFAFDTSSSTLPDTTIDTFGLTTNSTSLPSGSNKYFHLRTRDAAGNWSTTPVDRGAYWIDVTAPTSSVYSPSSSNSTSFTVFWAGSDSHSGIASYDVQYRDKTTNSAWTPWKSLTTQTSSTFYAASGHIYEFRSRARDNVGNLEAYPGVADLTTEVRTIDMYVKASGVEVNQAVQDLNNSVMLIANKRTFVRCYVQSTSGTISNVNARLRVYRDASLWGTLSPSNSGAQINIRTSPDRAQLNDAFYFDVPTGWLTAGHTMRFECEVNLPKKYAESNYGNNIGSTAANLTFVGSRPMNIAMIDVDYWFNGVVRHVRSVDRTRLAAWLRAAYPINQLNVYYGYFNPPYGSLPNVDTVNSDLAWNKSKKIFGAGETSSWRYYGQAYDIGGFMRGKSVGTPGNVAAGPTGDTSGWDPDGNFGDWYGGHENGHSYGRAHVRGAPYGGSGGCGDEAGPDGSYPYAQGRMSPGTSMWATNTLYGFDWSISSRFIVPPTWYDVMTYCPGQWISDYTYRAIWTRMNTEPVLLNRLLATGEHLAVFGSIVTSTNTITLSTLYRVPDSYDVFERDLAGVYHIKLLGAGNAVLADYNFSPRGDTEPDAPAQLITEYVPWITGTQQIVIASETQALITRTVSTHVPTVTLQAPTGGVTVTGNSLIASWTASDADNDPLTFSLDYSTDGGATWNPLSAQIPSTTVTLDATLLAGTTQGKFRVWVSDGVNTATDVTDGVFTVPNKAPQINAVLPLSGTNYVVSQTISFEAQTYDIEDGVLPDDHITWESDLDGVLGTGALLQIDTLSLGTHIITLSVRDNQNVYTTTTLVITVGPEEETGSIAPDVYLPLIMRN
jgi:hypothetical protein